MPHVKVLISTLLAVPKTKAFELRI